MTRVSRKRLDGKINARMEVNFYMLLGKAVNKEKTTLFCKEFFTRAERTMFAKRLAAIMLLNNEMTQDSITENIKMSPSTVSGISRDMDLGRFEHTSNLIGKGSDDFFDLIHPFISKPRLKPKHQRSYQSMYRSAPRSPDYQPRGQVRK